MSKFIFILLLLFSSMNSFGQNFFSKNKLKSNVINDSVSVIEKEAKMNVFNEEEINLLLNNNLCEILSIKPSDLMNEEMLKKLKAKV